MFVGSAGAADPLKFTFNDAPTPTIIAAVVFVPLVIALNAMDDTAGKQEDASGFVHVSVLDEPIARRPKEVGGLPGVVIFARSKAPFISAAFNE